MLASSSTRTTRQRWWPRLVGSGLFFVITALALYFFYFSTNTRRRTDRSWKAKEQTRLRRPFLNLTSTVLDLLEKAWVTYGVREQECRRRVACEAYLLAAVGVDKPEAPYSLRQVTEDDLTRVTSTRAEPYETFYTLHIMVKSLRIVNTTPHTVPTLPWPHLYRNNPRY
ncbi:hypothetical protein Pcinc_028013 [Petrolisthes cinctipes]|uniref:Uncharacterized protein n=1 Tax=Petrolisthes cinctipes TaxID=88211 RepID=A0AAE1K7V9_PETCI|nr:hypothetical protein Pcinc_028013 [Petrolisthes cinctipes]